MKLVLSCEHAVPDIPEVYTELFKENPGIIYTHEGYDPGALDLFKYLTELSDYNLHHSTGRLLVETNRSLKHPKLFSRFTKDLNAEGRNTILHEFYSPYREKIQSAIAGYINSEEKVLHISVHSFTSVLNGELRNCDIGLLYDPSKNEEKKICKSFKEAIRLENKEIRVRFNYPYLGKADGFTTYLRRKFPKNYIGIELEVNQSLVENNVMAREIKQAIFNSLRKVIEKVTA